MRLPTFYGKHDDLHLALIVAVAIAVITIGVLLAPSYPMVANVFVLVALCGFALFVALFDYGDRWHS